MPRPPCLSLSFHLSLRTRYGADASTLIIRGIHPVVLPGVKERSLPWEDVSVSAQMLQDLFALLPPGAVHILSAAAQDAGPRQVSTRVWLGRREFLAFLAQWHVR